MTSKIFQLEAVQAALREADLDGWLFAQFRGRDPIADIVLRRPADRGLETRRWFYWVPASGAPHKLVHAIEPRALDALPGVRDVYLQWQGLEDALARMLAGCRRVAMQYSPHNRIPYVGTADAGTVELLRDLGIEIVTSADLVQQFTAVLDDAQIAGHVAAADALASVVSDAFRHVRDELLANRRPTEYSVQQFIIERIAAAGFRGDPHEPPIVGVNANSADPHYCPDAASAAPIERGDWLLLDQWCRGQGEHAVWADVTWCAFVGERVPERHAEVFGVVRAARDAALDLIAARHAAGLPISGFEADRAARNVIESAGLGEHFTHRTGHSITHELHGTGANLDDLETHDTRQLVRRSCFSVEPGVYLPDFGVRLEVNVLIPASGAPVVTGRRQDRPIALLASDPEL